MGGQPVHPLLAFARELQNVATFGELLDVVLGETRERLGYQNAWLFIAETETDEVETMRLLAASGTIRSAAWEVAPRLTIRGDAMLEEIVRSDAPVVVVDARTDPRTDKRIVEQLGNRTIVNVPLRLLDRPFGAFGVGTFRDEGVVPPTAEQLDYLVSMASQIVVAAGRIRFLEERARAAEEKRALERRVLQMQKLESMGLLAGGVAHDFNNLLTVMLTMAGFLATNGPDERTREDGALLVATAERGRALTRQLLALSRTQPLQIEPVDLNQCLSELVAMVRRVLPASVAIELVPGAGLSAVAADAAQIDQVVMNLCINARDAMPKGGRLIIATSEARVDDVAARQHPGAKAGRYVLTTVRDTGFGMPKGVLDRIFEPFFTTKKEGEGTGIGLAVSYGIVAQHGGILTCESDMSSGTTFSLWLPVHTASPPRPDTTDTAAAGGSEQVLVAEDDPGVRSLAGRVLQEAGYDVTLVEDGGAACRAARERRFDLVLLDVVMPVMSGPDALKEIKAVLPGARFVLSTGHVGATRALEVVETENAVLLEKPFDAERLRRVVRQALDGRQR
jgi:signal transduction histidine kinase/ActR/RegA family two-component response regulator